MMYGHTVESEAKDADRYGCTVAICRADDMDLSVEMVCSGWVLALLGARKRRQIAPAFARKSKRAYAVYSPYHASKRVIFLFKSNRVAAKHNKM
jgi:endonuclease YncB( thermonuclease family)